MTKPHTPSHTPGPWVCASNDETIVLADTDRDDSIVVADTIVGERCDIKRAIANGRLISAAPDLLAALQGMLSIRGTWVKDLPGADISDWPKKAQAAIEKATGGA